VAESATAEAPPSEAAEQATPAAEPAATPTSAGDAEAGTRTVLVKAYPHGARIGYRGQQIGTNTAEVTIAPGERKALEIGLDGHSTRRLVVDGSKAEVTIVLKPKAR